MDITGDLLLEHLRADHGTAFEAERIRIRMRRRFSRPSADHGKRFNADRLTNRFLEYPRAMRAVREHFDLFHIVDHSYAHLVHVLPAGRTVVTCHDLDTFRSVLEPERVRKPWAFRTMTRRILAGMRRAAFVTCDSQATRSELLKHELLPPARTGVAYLGVYPGCSPRPNLTVDEEAARLVPPRPGTIELLHVGSTISRKRIDVLLRVFAEAHGAVPRLQLIRVGGDFTPEQTEMIGALGIPRDAITVRPFVHRSVLPGLYRRAALVLQPSDAEGFGLPVAEALACGAPVVASDLSVLREVGGAATTYCQVGDVKAWTEAVLGLIAERSSNNGAWNARVAAGVQYAERFTWANFATESAKVYQNIIAH